ncbi:MAG TPA: CmpA/NrtA family ABC transporter substrate-binding protein [Pseudomonas sp.]|nr:CmpA/NrtA family ABC transporter substrate-binding protein [Pseudomonas sp.]
MTDHSPRSDALAWAAGSDAPEQNVLELGFMPLADAAPLIVAATQGFAQPYGLTLNLRRQPSWASLRDKLLCGELDAAQMLYGQVYGIHLGLGGPATPMAILMGLNQNGQSITLGNALREAGVTSAEALRARTHQGGAKLTFAHTFPTGTHAMWLYYWLASHGIHPLRDVHSVVVPPAQMVAHLRAGRIDGFCAGDPWGAHAVDENQGFTVATSQSIWPDHPEKVLGVTREFVERCPNSARALSMALLEACRFIDASPENRRSTVQLLSAAEFVGMPVATLEPRFLGQYQDGLGHAWQDAHALRFFADGAVNMPYLSDGLWFLTQFRRWGLLRDDPTYHETVAAVHRLDLYREAAGALGITVPPPLRGASLCDGQVWDGSDPAGYARSFALHALDERRSAAV